MRGRRMRPAPRLPHRRTGGAKRKCSALRQRHLLGEDESGSHTRRHTHKLHRQLSGARNGRFPAAVPPPRLATVPPFSFLCLISFGLLSSLPRLFASSSPSPLSSLLMAAKAHWSLLCLLSAHRVCTRVALRTARVSSTRLVIFFVLFSTSSRARTHRATLWKQHAGTSALRLL